MWNPFRRAKVTVELPTEQPEPQVVAQVVVQPIEINPNERARLEFAEFKAWMNVNHLLGIKAANGDRREDHDKLIAEARSYGHSLVASGVWNNRQMKDLENKIKEVE